MTVVITILASDNSKNRYRARRAAKREQAMQDSSLARKIARSASGSQNVCRATSLGSMRDKPQQEVVHKQTRKYYTDANPFGNKIHAVQKMKLSSKPLI